MSVTRASQSYAPLSERDLLLRHADLVKRIAYHLLARLPASVDVDDLIQAGSIGLLEAARHYSGERGASFETYAGIRIRGAMIDELRRSDWAPRSVHRRLRDITQAIRDIEQESGQPARDVDIAAHLGLSLADYHEAVQDAARCQVLSLDEPLDDSGSSREIADPQASPLDLMQSEEFRAALAEAIRELPEREKLVMSMYYDNQLNLREIGQVLEITESRVCQIHGQALLRLRSKLNDWRAESIAS
jgi:RNA polymerase sigma factor FliA